MALSGEETPEYRNQIRLDTVGRVESLGRSDPSGDLEHEYEHEHERALLLKEYDDDASFELQNHPKDVNVDWAFPKKSLITRLAASRTTAFVLAACTTVLALAAASFIFRNNIESVASSFLEPEIREPQDYLLDPLWNYAAGPARRQYTWIVADQEHNPDGVYRPMLLINGMFPGPLIEVNEGDTVVVNIVNRAVNATAIHWHGIYQNHTNWMDGTVGITQCPIAPGTNFTYEFVVNGQSGTYWYHAHHGVQASDGLVGPFVVHSRDEKELQKIPYTTDRVIIVQDHYYDHSSALLIQYLAPDRENAEPVPGGALLNGKNVRNCDDLPHRRCDNSSSIRPEFTFEPNESHRIRFINAGAFAEFQIQIDEHEFAVTEIDGTDVWPEYYHRLNINPAQRYSIVFTANATTASAYWLRARMITHCFAEPNPELSAEVHGVIRYTSSSPLGVAALPSSRDWPEVIELQCRDMNTSDLRPVIPIEAPATADDLIYVRSNFMIGAWRLSRGFFNDSSWRPSVSAPSLHRFINGTSSSDPAFISSLSVPFGVNDRSFSLDRELVYQTNGIRTIDIMIQNFDDGNHPMHLHGYKYWVLAQGHGYPPSGLMSTLDLRNPLRRDTASVEAFGWTLLRFTADNAGLWAFHCHISWHTEAGLLMQFLTRADDVATWELPPMNGNMCSIDGHEKGKGPDDSTWYGQ